MEVKISDINKYATFLLVLFIEFSYCTNKPEPPNIIYILADDLGYGELGAYGQEIIETPNLDALAKNGMLFTQHYAGSPVCAPSRSVLLTGQHTGHTYIRGNDEWKERGKVWDYNAVFNDPGLEGQRPLPDSVVTIAEILQQNGYRTGFIGKWGLGAPETESTPNKQGFDYFYGYNCQRQAHTLYPMHLWENGDKILLNNKSVPPHSNLPDGADPNDPENYADFTLKDYAPELMHLKALNFIESSKEGPFFLLYASPLPHLPLQAKEKWVNYYKTKLGIEEPYTGKSYFPNQTPRATYAAMISTLDEQVGDLVVALVKNKIWENTLIIFTSDNGPTYAGGPDTKFFNSAKPFKSDYGWSKGFLHEGGIRVPMIASWPNKIKYQSKTDHVSAFQDIMSTICEIIRVPPVSITDGISFLSTLLGEKQTSTHDFLYWEIPEYSGQQAVRIGNYKAIRKNIFKGNLEIELYDLKTDIQETINVAEQFPEIVKRAEKIILREHASSEISSFKFSILGD